MASLIRKTAVLLCKYMRRCGIYTKSHTLPEMYMLFWNSCFQIGFCPQEVLESVFMANCIELISYEHI